MITYEQLYNLYLDSFTSAVEDWDFFISKLKAMDEACTHEVVKPFEKAGWTSSDMTSVIAQARVAAVNREFSDALQEAKGIRGVLRDAHEALKKHKADLHQLADEDAKRDGLVVSAKGKITPRDDLSEDEGRRHDPDGQKAIAEQQRSIEALQARIERVLNDAAETDREASMTLRRDIGKENNDFNGKAAASIGADQAGRASNLLKKLDQNETLSQHDLNELERLMSHNQHDPEFNKKLLNGLGPKKTLELADELDQIRHMDQVDGDEYMYEGDRKQYATIEHSLANGIGAANKDKEFSEQWRGDMRKLGTEPVTDGSGDSYNTLGYQALTGLLKHGDGEGYPAHMTTGLTDDIIKAERHNPGVWDEAQTINYGGDAKPQECRDPVDDMLGVMSKDPDTSTRYLDPAHGGEKRLEYLLDKRDWPDIHVSEQSQGAAQGTALKEYDKDPTNSRTGLGNVLEAATTGVQPGQEKIDYSGHTEGQARVMQSTIERLDNYGHGGGDKIPENMHRPLARALSDYTADTHNIIAGEKREHDHPGGQKNILGEGDNAHITASERSVIRVLRGVSSEPENFAQVYESERFYAADQMGKASQHPGNANEHWQVPATNAGNVLGAYNAIGSDVYLDERDDKKQWADDTAKQIYHGVGLPITAIPVVGDAAQRMLDQGTYDWTKDVKSAADAHANDKSASEMADGVGSTNDIIDRWEHDRERHGRPVPPMAVQQMRQLAEHGYITSRESAFGALDRGGH
ncbi:hypothetical protein [Streptomyces tubercidicus]|uniref:hypothetical protein n=1 Tax=Streptomyces tubercidicus TaxID=47759 RepID=UPI003465E8EC